MAAGPGAAAAAPAAHEVADLAFDLRLGGLVVITRGVDVTVNAFYKHSRIKQYLKLPDEAAPCEWSRRLEDQEVMMP